MSKKEQITLELDRIPDDMLDEVLDFVRFLQAKRPRSAGEAALLSEAALAKDWLTPEEDEAWSDL